MRANNHKVLITGGTRGIGFSLAKRFLETGNDVIITGRSSSALAQAINHLPGAIGFIADMMSLADLQQIHREYPDITVLVNNAGVQYNYEMIGSHHQFDRISTEIQTNFQGLVQLTALYLPDLSQRQESAVINISSGLAFVPKQSAPVYCATKAAVHSFTQALRWQLEHTPVHVCEVIPSLVETDMTAGREGSKITTDALVEQFWQGYLRNQTQIKIGRVALLLHINRWLPLLAERIIRHG
jgi:uncharacterized oxidoreductase